MKTFFLADVDCPQVIFEVGDQQIESTIITNMKKTPNFDKPLLFLDVVSFGKWSIFGDISSSLDVTERRFLCTSNEY